MFERKKPYNHYSYYQALGLAFYSPKIYIDAAKRWAGIGAIYLLLLCFILAVPIACKFIIKTQEYFKDTLEPGVKAMPTLLIHDKKLSFEFDKKEGITKKTSFWIWPRNPDAEHPYPDIVINLPRTLESFSSVFIPVLITQDYIQVQNFSPWGQSVVTDQFKIDKESDGELGSKELMTIIKQIKKNLVNTAYPYLSWLMWASILPFIMFFASLVNIFYFSIYRKKLPWIQSVRVLCIAITPTLVVLEVLYFCNEMTRNWIIFSLILTVGYYFIGSRACLMDTEPAQR